MTNEQPWARSSLITVGSASASNVTSHVFFPGYSMPAVIANQFGEASGVMRSALIGLGVLLFFITIIVNLAARSIVEWNGRRMRGA